jgi:hypothetical protein
VLLAGVARAAWTTVADRRAPAREEAPLRMAALCSLAALGVTSALGFPWHLASTLALGALCLAVLAASDARLADGPSRLGAAGLAWRPVYGQLLAMGALVGVVLAAYVSVQAAQAERRLVTAARLGLAVAASGEPDNPRFADARTRMLNELREGVALAPNYRVLIEQPVEQLTRWRDWKNAAWGWEVLSAARPYSLGPMLQAARARAMAGETAQAQAWVDKARQARPDSTAWMGVAVLLAARAGDDRRAVELGREAMNQGQNDFTMLNTAFEAAWRTAQFDTAVAFMEQRMASYPSTRQAGLILLGNMFTTGSRQPARALAYLKEALALSAPADRAALRPKIPSLYWAELGLLPEPAKQKPNG